MLLETKRGDTEPNEFILKDGNEKTVNFGDPPNQADVTFFAKPVVEGVGQVVSRVCVVLQEAGGVNRGHGQIPWEAIDVALAGTHRAEFEVIFGDGTRKTFPSDGYVDWIVWSDLG